MPSSLLLFLIMDVQCIQDSAVIQNISELPRG